MPEKFTAKQASELADSKQIPIDEILKNIENCASYGNRFLMFTYLPDSIVLELVNLGYTVSKHTDPFGVEQTKVKW